MPWRARLIMSEREEFVVLAALGDFDVLFASAASGSIEVPKADFDGTVIP